MGHRCDSKAGVNRENLFKTSLLLKYLRSALQEVRPERALLAVHTRDVSRGVCPSISAFIGGGKH